MAASLGCRSGRRSVYQKAMKPAEQARRIVELWLERPKNRRTEEDVDVFFGWLSEHAPALIPASPGSYHQLQQILASHVVRQS